MAARRTGRIFLASILLLIAFTRTARLYGIFFIFVFATGDVGHFGRLLLLELYVFHRALPTSFICTCWLRIGC